MYYQSQPGKQSGKITLLYTISDKLREVKAELTEHDYTLPVKTYQEQLPIIFTGELIKKSKYG
jgi:hypothetical protein